MSEEKPAGKDCIIPLGPIGPDLGFPALRIGRDGVAAGMMTPVVDGKPLGERDILSLEPVDGLPAYEATVLYEGRRPSSSQHAGPALVNSQQFRSGWDAVFGKSPPKAVAAN